MDEQDKVREMAGIVSHFSDRRVWLKEADAVVIFEVSTTSEILLNTASARRLARQLHRLATRVDKRIAAREAEARSK